MRWADGTAVVTHSPAPAATTTASRGTVRAPRVTEGPLYGWLDMCADIYQVLMGALRGFRLDHADIKPWAPHVSRVTSV
ncbi:hypothetical protein SVIO_057900 [Streptomyces violaceusniger]|uniref:Uncharacterized protein n=1 Tax=Streptomyces violaceusniger TaxID=68280 RepID=A0A4D4L970_STRVO|nr:hypothetical protein SVIO_057900 [Streptomyces violaceusniger]